VFAWRVPQGLSGELLDQFRQPLQQLLPHHGQEGYAHQHRRPWQPALEDRREKGTCEDAPFLQRAEKYITLPGDKELPPTFIIMAARAYREGRKLS
jgi:hypothetical protein